MPTPSRLERAMAIFLQSQVDGADPDAVLQQHPDLRELLEPLLLPEPATGSGGDGGTLGDFELVREVGRGGMGVVHEARQRSLGRRVALKVLTSDPTADPTRLARFRREAVTLARLDHPHIVRVFDTGETAGTHWLAMEFVDGESLDQLIARLQAAGGHRDGSLRELVEIVLAVAEALQHVHAMGILHRDIKPSNVLLGADGRRLLSDFGLARDERAPTLTQQGFLAGTPHYLAPEYLASGTMTAAADVWALGATLYEAITLRRPFDGATNEVVLQQVRHHDPADPRPLQPGLHQDLAAIALHALEKDPQRRYPTMAAFAADLRAFLDLRPTVARPPTRTQRLKRWVRREPLRAGLAVSLGLLLGLGAFVLVRLPTIRAGERAAQAADYEAAIAEGFVRRGDGNRELAFAAAHRALELRPDAGEAMVVAALAKLRFQSPAAALQELDRLTGLPHDDDDACQRLRALILGRLDRPMERDAVLAKLAAPPTQMGLLLAAGLLVEQQTTAGNAEARQLISLATRIAAPRLLVHCQWATLAGPEDRAECAEALLRLWPEHPFALHLAATHVQWTEPQRAFELQQQALRLGLQDQWAQFNLAAYATKAGEIEAAVAAAKLAMADPQMTEERRPGLLQIFADHAPESLEWATAEWRRHFPGSRHAPREHGKQLALRGEHDRAIAMLQELLAGHPDDRAALHELGFAFLGAERWADTTAVAARMMAIDPSDRNAHNLCVDALEELEELPGSAAPRAAELRRWLTLASDDGRAARDLAELLLAGPKQGHAEALSLAMRADRSAGGKDQKALDLLARVHDALGEAAAATAVRERLTAQEPTTGRR